MRDKAALMWLSEGILDALSLEMKRWEMKISEDVSFWNKQV